MMEEMVASKTSGISRPCESGPKRCEICGLSLDAGSDRACQLHGPHLWKAGSHEQVHPGDNGMELNYRRYDFTRRSRPSSTSLTADRYGWRNLDRNFEMHVGKESEVALRGLQKIPLS